MCHQVAGVRDFGCGGGGDSGARWPGDSDAGGTSSCVACTPDVSHREVDLLRCEGALGSGVLSREDGDRSVGQIAEDFDLTESTQRLWVSQAEVDIRPSSNGHRPGETRIRRRSRRGMRGHAGYGAMG